MGAFFTFWSFFYVARSCRSCLERFVLRPFSSEISVGNRKRSSRSRCHVLLWMVLLPLSLEAPRNTSCFQPTAQKHKKPCPMMWAKHRGFLLLLPSSLFSSYDRGVIFGVTLLREWIHEHVVDCVCSVVYCFLFRYAKMGLPPIVGRDLQLYARTVLTPRTSVFALLACLLSSIFCTAPFRDLTSWCFLSTLLYALYSL